MRKFNKKGNMLENALVLFLVVVAVIALSSALASVAAIKGRDVLIREDLKKATTRLEAIESEFRSRGYLAPTTK